MPPNNQRANFLLLLVVAPLIAWSAWQLKDRLEERKATCEPVNAAGPMVQRAYVWQRDWTPQVSQSVSAHASSFDGLAVLAAQVEWRASPGDAQAQSPTIIRPKIDWSAFLSTGKALGLVLRVHRAGSVTSMAETITQIFQERLAEASAASLTVGELQIDYDCPQKELTAYLAWLRLVRHELRSTGIPLRITTLPSWLQEPGFAALAEASDGYILQVHSFDLTRLGKSPSVCDAAETVTWVAQAARLDRPFFVALPTYHCLAGYAPDGRYLGMAADAGSPNWPPGTKVLEMNSDADSLARLIAGWAAHRPAAMKGIYWYRLPIDGESRNWRWRTLAAVMAGRAPLSRWEVQVTGENPKDFSLKNAGERDEPLPQRVHIHWSDPARIAIADALGHWTYQTEPEGIEFGDHSNGMPARIAPGNSIPLGWIRYREASPLDNSFSYEIVP